MSDCDRISFWHFKVTLIFYISYWPVPYDPNFLFPLLHKNIYKWVAHNRSLFLTLCDILWISCQISITYHTIILCTKWHIYYTIISSYFISGPSRILDNAFQFKIIWVSEFSMRLGKQKDKEINGKRRKISLFFERCHWDLSITAQNTWTVKWFCAKKKLWSICQNLL